MYETFEVNSEPDHFMNQPPREIESEEEKEGEPSEWLMKQLRTLYRVLIFSETLLYTLGRNDSNE